MIFTCNTVHRSFLGLSVVTLLTALTPLASAQMPTDGLIGFWPGNGSAVDASPVGNNGTFGGNYVSGAPGGKAFDLATDQVTAPDIPDYDFTNYSGWTVGFWFNTNNLQLGSTGDTFLGQDDGSGYQAKWFINYGYTVFGQNTQFGWHVNDTNQERIFLNSNPVALPSGWNQLTVVTDNSGRTVSFYLNAQPIGTDALPSYVLRPSASLIFGYAEPNLSYSGLMNNVVLYDQALSPGDVAKLVAAAPEPSPRCPLLIGCTLLLMPLGFGRRRHAYGTDVRI
jgi:hypothetical protein